MRYFVAIDVETTGLNPGEHAICQFGCSVFTEEQILVTAAWDVYVSPTKIAGASKEALEINGISEERMLKGMDFEAVLREFEKLYHTTAQESEIWAAVMHNAPFDVGFLRASNAVRRDSLTNHLLRRVLDTVTMGFAWTGELLSLEKLCERFLPEGELVTWAKHDAGADAHMTARLAQKLMSR